MKKYRKRDGIVLANICGEYLLIATKDAREYCPYVSQINDLAVKYWECMTDSKGCSFAEILKNVIKVTGKDKNEVIFPLMSFLSKLSKAGYILTENNE